MQHLRRNPTWNVLASLPSRTKQNALFAEKPHLEGSRLGNDGQFVAVLPQAVRREIDENFGGYAGGEVAVSRDDITGLWVYLGGREDNLGEQNKRTQCSIEQHRLGVVGPGGRGSWMAVVV